MLVAGRESVLATLFELIGKLPLDVLVPYGTTLFVPLVQLLANTGRAGSRRPLWRHAGILMATQRTQNLLRRARCVSK